jgi:hypothetical protein
LVFIFDNFLCGRKLGNLGLHHYEAVEGFFDASQGRGDNTSFEGANKSGVLPKRLLNSRHAHARQILPDVWQMRLCQPLNCYEIRSQRSTARPGSTNAVHPQSAICNPQSAKTFSHSRRWRKRSKIPV